MDVDHAGTPMMTIGTGDASVIVGTVTDMTIINAVEGIAATGDLTGTATGVIAIGTRIVEPGLAAAASVAVVVGAKKIAPPLRGAILFLRNEILLIRSRAGSRSRRLRRSGR